MTIDAKSEEIFLNRIKTLKKYGWLHVEENFYSLTTEENVELIKRYLLNDKLVKDVN